MPGEVIIIRDIMDLAKICFHQYEDNVARSQLQIRVNLVGGLLLHQKITINFEDFPKKTLGFMPEALTSTCDFKDGRSINRQR